MANLFALTLAVFAVLALCSVATGSVIIFPKAFQHHRQTSSSSNSSTLFIDSFNHGLSALLSFHNNFTQFFSGTGFWNTGNCYQLLVNAALVDLKKKTKLSSHSTSKFTSSDKKFPTEVLALVKHAHLSFEVYVDPDILIDHISCDDFLWWTVMWTEAHDLAHALNDGNAAKEFLATAVRIWRVIGGFWDMRCGGGVWWCVCGGVAASITRMPSRTSSGWRLHRRLLCARRRCRHQHHHHHHHHHLLSSSMQQQQSTGSSSSSNSNFSTWAQREWDWFVLESTMINSQNLINDGLDFSTCKNNRATTWSYNQGVIVSAAVNMYRLNNKKNISYIDEAVKLVNASLDFFLKGDGGGGGAKKVLVEGACDPSSSDCCQFPGIYFNRLMWLHSLLKEENLYPVMQRRLETAFFANAQSICSNDVEKKIQDGFKMDFFGLKWTGPFDGVLDACRQSSAMNAILAAIVVAS